MVCNYLLVVMMFTIIIVIHIYCRVCQEGHLLKISSVLEKVALYMWSNLSSWTVSVQH